MTRKRQKFIAALADGKPVGEAVAEAGYTWYYGIALSGSKSVQEAVARRRAYLESLDGQTWAQMAITRRLDEIEIMVRTTIDGSQSPRVRAAATVALGRWAKMTGDVGIEQHLKMLAGDAGQHERVRIAAVRALGRFRRREGARHGAIRGKEAAVAGRTEAGED